MQDDYKIARRYKALVVEDDRFCAALTRGILLEIGFLVDNADSGAAAIEKFKRDNYDIIFMDIDLPVMNGYVATRKIRTIEGSNHRAYIVAFTSYLATKQDVALCLNSGMNDCLSKPARKQDFLRRVPHWEKHIVQKRAAISSS